MEPKRITILFIFLIFFTWVSAEDTRELPFSQTDEVPSHQVSQNFSITKCNDYLPDCNKYKYTVCYEYQPWALQRCAAYCEFCKVSPLYTTPTPPCNDTIPNCQEFNSDTCTNPYYHTWAKKNCRKFCNFCHETDHPPFVWTTTTMGPTTTVNPNCHDLLPNCESYGRKSCTGVYADWAGVRCRAFCNFCGTSPPPTTEPPCVDKMSNCKEFQMDTCTNPLYKSWAAQNCRAYCKICTPTTPGSTVTSMTVTTPTPTTTTTTTTTQTPQAPYFGHGATGPSGNFFTCHGTSHLYMSAHFCKIALKEVCVYKGVTYAEGAEWDDGSQFKCNCVNAEFNDVSCTDMCPSWNLPSFCQLISVPGKPCPTVHCSTL